MQLTLAFSPCPNDTFIFDAMVHGKVDTEGLSFDPVLLDVETLNRHALEGKYDITKLSFHALGYATDQYALLLSGSALGNNCGPLLIARRPLSLEEILEGPVAIPGQYTTAHFLLNLAYPGIRNKKEMVFSDIEEAVLREEVVAGLIIHENRFTYESKGLIKIMDCGEYWETNYKLPIPLGGIAVNRRLPEALQRAVERIIRRSAAHAMYHPDSSAGYVACHAQEMDPEVMKQHIQLYVNTYTLDLGRTGRQAVETLFRVAREKGVLPPTQNGLWIA